MDYVRGVLSGVAAIVIVALGRFFWFAFRTVDGPAVVDIGLIVFPLPHAARSPLFWLSLVCLFAIFFAVSRVKSRAVRVIFFWIPTVTACVVGATFSFLLTYLALGFRHS
jgi:hypothetical protein